MAGEDVKYEFLGHILRSLVAFFVVILNEAKTKFWVGDVHVVQNSQG